MTHDLLSERRAEIVEEIRQIDSHIASLQNQLSHYQQTRLVRSGQLLEIKSMIDARSKQQEDFLSQAKEAIDGGDDA